jgi:hypothetical protein
MSVKSEQPSSAIRIFSYIKTVMHMNKSEALSKIQVALTGDAQVITPKGEIYEEYVQRLSQELLANVIEPIEVTVVSTCEVSGDFERYKCSTVWAIANHDSSWLLTLEKEKEKEKENEFALGFGDDPKKIMMHGFSSSDVLGEWCA